MKTTTILILTIIFGFICCEKTTDNSDLMLKAGFNCGFGSGTDSLAISKTNINYVYYVPAQSQIPLIKISRNVTDSEWTEILNDINIGDFAKLNYNSSDISMDGCDEWIYIQDDKISHEIRYSKGLKIQTISKLQAKLVQYRTEFNNLIH